MSNSISKEAFGRRLQDARIAAGFRTRQQFSSTHGINDSVYSRHESGDRMPQRSTVLRYSQLLKVSVGWLLSGEGDSQSPPPTIPGGRPPLQIEYVMVTGAVQAGEWRESLEWPQEDHYAVPVIPSKRFPGVERYAAEVRGDSMSQKFPDGNIVFLVRFADISQQPQHGQYVLVQRTDPNSMVEATLKRLDIRGGVAWLMPESDDPQFTPIRLGEIRTATGYPPMFATAAAGNLPDDADVEIVALVEQHMGPP